MPPAVAIIILNFNGRTLLGNLLDKALESAINQTYENLEVIFIDNGSTDDSYEYVKSRYGSKVKVVRFTRNYGYCLGNNLALKYIPSNTKYILFMNPDVILSKDYVGKLVSVMESDKSIGIAQGLELSFDDSKVAIGGFIDSYGRSFEVNVKGLRKPREFFTRPIVVLRVIGSAMMIRRDVFEGLGGFPHNFFMYFDEVDLCIRAFFKGYKIVCLPATVYRHKGGLQGDKVEWIRWYFYHRNQLLLSIRYLPLRTFLITIFLVYPEYFISTLINSIKTGDKSGVRLFLRIVKYLKKNFRRELAIRSRYSDKIHMMKKLIIKNPRIVKWYQYASRVAWAKVLRQIMDKN